MKVKLIVLIVLPAIFISCISKTEPGSNPEIQELTSPATTNSYYPNLYTDNTGTLFMSWLEKDNSVYNLRYSVFKKDAWTEPQSIASDSTWFINWADYPSIIAQNGEPVAAHWLNKVQGGTYAYHVNMALFNENKWEDPFTLHEDNSATEHGFVSMESISDSTFAAVWLDGRQTENRSDHEYMDIDKAMTLRAGIVSNITGTVNEFLVDDAICDCCNTSITQTDRGFMVAYRDRTENEIRDIYTASFIDGVWNEPKPVHNDGWEIAACPVNGPALDAENQTVAVAWFTGADGTPSVKLAISEDLGNSFEEPIILDDKEPAGRVDVVISSQKIWVSWLASHEENNSLEIRSFDFDGAQIDSLAIPGLSGSRSLGFPQISEYKDGLLVAYTDVSGENPVVRTFMLEKGS
jgi:hypothetical protein